MSDRGRIRDIAEQQRATARKLQVLSIASANVGDGWERHGQLWKAHYCAYKSCRALERYLEADGVDLSKVEAEAEFVEAGIEHDEIIEELGLKDDPEWNARMARLKEMSPGERIQHA